MTYTQLPSAVFMNQPQVFPASSSYDCEREGSIWDHIWYNADISSALALFCSLWLGSYDDFSFVSFFKTELKETLLYDQILLSGRNSNLEHLEYGI